VGQDHVQTKELLQCLQHAYTLSTACGSEKLQHATSVTATSFTWEYCDCVCLAVTASM